MNGPLARTFGAIACAAIVAPVALAHDGGRDRDRRDGWNHHRHHRVVLKGTVTSIDLGDKTVVVDVQRARRGGRALVGHKVTVKVFGGRVADTNGDGKHGLADVKDGDRVRVKTKRRFIDADANKIARARLIDLSHLSWTRQP
jgi:hypothetical protein